MIGRNKDWVIPAFIAAMVLIMLAQHYFAG
jgi:hypothetical protein